MNLNRNLTQTQDPTFETRFNFNMPPQRFIRNPALTTNTRLELDTQSNTRI